MVAEAGGSIGDTEELQPGAVAIASPVPGAVWKINVAKGARVKEGDVLVVVESMKMEMSVHAPASGVVCDIRCAEGKPVALGQTLAVLVGDRAEAAQ